MLAIAEFLLRHSHRIRQRSVLRVGLSRESAKIYCPRANSWINRSPSSSVNKERLQSRIRLEYVVPRLLCKYPKPVWAAGAAKLIADTPSGDVTPPATAAQVIPGLSSRTLKAAACVKSGALRRIPEIPWRRLDAGACDRDRRAGLRRLSVPGIAPRWRRRRHRPRLLSRAAASQSRRHSRGNEHSAARSLLAKPAWLYRPNPT